MKLTPNQQKTLLVYARVYGESRTQHTESVLVDYVEEISTEREQLVVKRMTDWADELEAEGPTGRFIATEVRNRLKGHKPEVAA